MLVLRCQTAFFLLYHPNIKEKKAVWQRETTSMQHQDTARNVCRFCNEKNFVAVNFTVAHLD